MLGGAPIAGRTRAVKTLIEAFPGRVAAYGLENHAGTPVYVHAKVCVIDDVWASVGSDNFNRRSWTHDSELSCVVLDDDPTGVQTLAGVRVLLDWDAERVGAALVGRRAVHLVTNSRALPPDRVERLVADASRVAREAAPDARVVLRGDVGATARGDLRLVVAGRPDLARELGEAVGRA